MSMDYPRAWQLARSVALVEHEEMCSFRQTTGGVLCDCRVITEHTEYKDDVLHGMDGVPCGCCYYCSGPHEDDPCPVRVADAERYRRQGEAMYPNPIVESQWEQWIAGGRQLIKPTGDTNHDSTGNAGHG